MSGGSALEAGSPRSEVRVVLDRIAMAMGEDAPDAHEVPLLVELAEALDRRAPADAVAERLHVLDEAGFARAAAALVASHPAAAEDPELARRLAALLLDAVDPDLGRRLVAALAAESTPAGGSIDFYRRVHVQLGDALAEAGDYAGARRAYEAVLAYRVDDPWALAGLRKVGAVAGPRPTRGGFHVAGLSEADLGGLGGRRYRVVRPIGRGRHAVVYLAEDLVLQRHVAIKRLLPAHALPDPNAARVTARRFLDEAKTLATVASPYVVRIFDRLPRQQAVVLEYCPGGSLRDGIRAGTVGPADLPDLAHALRRALAAVHAAGAVHRDIKPANVLLRHRTDAARFVLADFGLARQGVRGGDRAGTLRYLAPELRAGRGEATPASDAYAAGVVLLEVAWAPKGLFAPFDDPRGPGPFSPTWLPPGLPPGMAETIAGLLAPDPTARTW